MIKYGCSKTDCTVALTGKCLLSHVPVDACPHAHAVRTDATGIVPELQPEEIAPAIVNNGNEVGFQQASEILAARYGHLIGVLGAHATGKTCLLCSLYLLASCGDLRPKQLFAGSMTLPGFESRLRRLRGWPETALPDKIVDHTFLAHPRQPGLLHLALRQTTPIRKLRDFFFTDLPGEWTTDLINRAEVAERFRFLLRADGIVIALPAPRLLDPETRHSEIQATRILLQRLRDAVGIDRAIPIILAITRCDQTGPIIPPAAYQIVQFGRDIGFPNISHVCVAAFSERPDVPSGMGLGALLEPVLEATSRPPIPLPDLSEEPRMFGKFRYSFEAGA